MRAERPHKTPRTGSALLSRRYFLFRSSSCLLPLGYDFLDQLEGSIDHHHLSMTSPMIWVALTRLRTIGALDLSERHRRHKRKDRIGFLRCPRQLDFLTLWRRLLLRLGAFACTLLRGRLLPLP